MINKMSLIIIWNSIYGVTESLVKIKKIHSLSIRDKPVVLIIIIISCCYITDDHFFAFVIYYREEVE